MKKNQMKKKPPFMLQNKERKKEVRQKNRTRKRQPQGMISQLLHGSRFVRNQDTNRVFSLKSGPYILSK
jgi:hypothetical protein